jgi:hypothetical protein
MLPGWFSHMTYEAVKRVGRDDIISSVCVSKLAGLRYLRFLRSYLPQLPEDVSLRTRQRMCFLHDAAPARFRLAVRQWLGRHYPGHWIGRGPEAPALWPPRSPDLNPIDFYKWGCRKNAVYANTVDTRQQLWQRIQDAANEILSYLGARTRPSLVPTSCWRMCLCPWRECRALVATC